MPAAPRSKLCGTGSHARSLVSRSTTHAARRGVECWLQKLTATLTWRGRITGAGARMTRPGCDGLRPGYPRSVPGRVGVLFWFYRDLPVCRNRAEMLRRDNPELAIFGLYGGDVRDAARFRDALEPFLDDF